MNMLIKRRQLIVATLVVALGSAVFVNWYFTNSDEKTVSSSETQEYVQNLGEAKYVNSGNTEADKSQEVISNNVKKDDYFATAKLQRTKSNDKALENLKELLETENANEKTLNAISSEVEALGERIKLEADIESLITSKLKCECIVILSDKNAEIVIEKGNLNETAILQITDAILTNTEIKASDIKISES